MTKEFKLIEMQQLHKMTCPQIMFEYFMDNYCHKLLEETHGLKKVYVIVDTHFKFEYRKKTLEVA